MAIKIQGDSVYQLNLGLKRSNAWTIWCTGDEHDPCMCTHLLKICSQHHQIRERFPVWCDRTLTVDVMRRNWGRDDWRWKLKSHGGPESSGAHTHTSRTQVMHIDMSVHSVWMVFVGVWHPDAAEMPPQILTSNNATVCVSIGVT